MFSYVVAMPPVWWTCLEFWSTKRWQRTTYEVLASLTPLSGKIYGSYKNFCKIILKLVSSVMVSGKNTKHLKYLKLFGFHQNPKIKKQPKPPLCRTKSVLVFWWILMETLEYSGKHMNKLGVFPLSHKG